MSNISFRDSEFFANVDYSHYCDIYNDDILFHYEQFLSNTIV
jgi:hypothetical protein